MLHARSDCMRIQDPEHKIPADEPCFLLRGQDPFAPEILLRYAGKLRLSGGNPDMARMVEDHAQKMMACQALPKVRIHTPNVPNEILYPADQSEK